MPSGSLPFVAAEKTGAKTLDEFVAYAKKAEKVNVGTYGAGSYAHMAVAEMNKQYGLKMEAVHYRGEAPMWTDLAGGFIDGAHRQLFRGAVRAAERPRPCGRRLAQAHVDAARRSFFRGAGHDIADLQADRLPVLRGAHGHAGSGHSEAVETAGRRRQDREGAAADEDHSASTTPR